MKKILSTTLVRVLAVVCGLFGCTLTGYAYYEEGIDANNKGFYVYNMANGMYIKNNGGGISLVANIEDASVWTFSGKSGKISMKNGNYYLDVQGKEGTSAGKWGISYEIDPGENAEGPVSLLTTDTKFTIGGGKDDGYSMSNTRSYGFKIGSAGLTSRTYYFSNTLTSVQNQSTATRWKLVSKRQVDNTISLSSTTLTLEAIQGAPAVEKQFDVNHNGALTTITLTGGTESLTINSPAKPAPINVAFQVDPEGLKTIIISDANDETNKATYSFDKDTEASVQLTVSTTAASGDATEDDKETITITGKVVTLKEQSIEWTQDFSALTPASAPIALNAVAKTAGGVATGKAITYTLASTGVVKIVNNTLYVLSEGNTSITASVDKDGTYQGAEKTLIVKVSGVSASATTITPSNASNSGIYTGTIGGPSDDYKFHHAKRMVNLTKCFNTSGTALFDTLYVFGITTNTDGTTTSYVGKDGKAYTNVPIVNTPTAEVGCNATTPCYVFAKSGNSYVHTRTFDAVKTRYDWGNKQNGKHIYFTGYCPFAYVGTTKNENGWMYFVGGENETVDIYLDSCQIKSRYKTQSGKNAEYEKYKLEVEVTKVGEGEGDVNISYLEGSSSPFLFTGTSTDEDAPFKPSIHIAGKNHLKGQLGSIINETHGNVDYLVQTTLNLNIGGVNTYSAPIAIKPLDVNCFTNLELTDIWKDNTITNGYLRLDATDVSETMAEKAYTVDLGSANGSLTINGGQYHLRNAAADGNYTCNMAVGYRRYKKTVAVTLGGSDLVVQAALYGFGDDITDSKVTINSGTFTMHKNMYEDPNVEYGCLGSDYYRDKVNFLDLRLPAGDGKSAVNGGTFNGISNVSMCKSVISSGGNPINSIGVPLVLKDISATTTVDGLANFDLTTMNKIDEFYDPSPYVTYNLVDDIENVETGLMYGGQSANAYTKDGKSVVTLLLPTELCGVEEMKESVILQWATALPYIDAVKEVAGFTNSLTMCGPIEVLQTSTSEDLVYETKQLIYADFEGIENAQYKVAASEAGLRIKEGVLPRGRIDNVEPYQITRNINMLKVVQADTWYTFTAPFDVHEISVIEANNSTYRESTIAENNKKDRTNAMKLQAEANLHLLYGIYTLILPNDEGRASSLTFNELLGQSYVLQTKQVLEHYDGTNIMDAHYYLYELDSLDANGHFSTNGTRDALNIDWKPVNRKADEPLLKKGQTYAMQFPWCPMCNDLYVDDPAKKRTYYDYWSNKMILFHGNGPQTIEGSSSQSTILSPPAEGKAKLTGNSTFADMTLAAETGYVHNTTTDYFEKKNDSYPLKPTEGFLLYNPGAKSMPARISRTGQIEYDENAETGVDGVPTVGDRTSLMLFGAYDGFEVLALHEQLVTVYNLQGNIIFQQYMTAGEQVYVATGAGIYVVRGEREAIKVMVD